MLWQLAQISSVSGNELTSGQQMGLNLMIAAGMSWFFFLFLSDVKDKGILAIRALPGVIFAIGGIYLFVHFA